MENGRKLTMTYFIWDDKVMIEYFDLLFDLPN